MVGAGAAGEEEGKVTVSRGGADREGGEGQEEEGGKKGGGEGV